jgi:MFS family permease
MNISPGVILWMSRLLAILSERVRGLVLPWVFLGITAGAAKTSYLASIYQIPSVALAFFLGILAHKIGAKSSYVAATLLSIAVLLFIYMLYLTHGLSFPRLAALSLALGIGECIQRISLNTFIVGLSQAVNLTRYYSMAEVADAVSTFVGPILGGLIIVTGTRNGLLADSVLLFLSLVFFARIPKNNIGYQEDERRIDLRDILKNIKQLASATSMPLLLFVSLLLNIQGGTLILLIVIIGRAFLHLNSVAVATSISAAGAGAVFGSAFSGWTQKRKPVWVALYTFLPGLIGSGLLIATVLTRSRYLLPLSCFLIDLSSSIAFVLVLVWNAELSKQIRAKSVVTGIRATLSGASVILGTLALCSSAAFSRLIISAVTYFILFLTLLLVVARTRHPSPWDLNFQSNDQRQENRTLMASP